PFRFGLLADKKLASSAILIITAPGSRDNSSHVLVCIELSLDSRLIRLSHSPCFGRTILRVGISALNDRIRDHPMKCDAVVEAFPNKLLEILHMLWRVTGKEFDNDPTHIGLKHCCLIIDLVRRLPLRTIA